MKLTRMLTCFAFVLLTVSPALSVQQAELPFGFAWGQEPKAGYTRQPSLDKNGLEYWEYTSSDYYITAGYNGYGLVDLVWVSRPYTDVTILEDLIEVNKTLTSRYGKPVSGVSFYNGTDDNLFDCLSKPQCSSLAVEYNSNRTTVKLSLAPVEDNSSGVIIIEYQKREPFLP